MGLGCCIIRNPLDEQFLNTFANTPHKRVCNYPGGSALSSAFTEHCVSKWALSRVLANHLSLHSPTTQHLHLIGWLKQSTRQSGSATSASAYMSMQPLHLYLREIKTPIMQYEFGSHMHHLSKRVSKILSGICLKHGVYLEVNNSHKFVCHL